MKVPAPSDPLAFQIASEIDTLLMHLLVDGAGAVSPADLEQLAEHAHLAAIPQLAAGVRALATARQPAELSAGLAGLKRFVDRARQTAAPVEPAKGVNHMAQDQEMLADFVMESREHLASVEQQLLALEQDPANFEGMHALFRSFHTIKGMAGFLELENIQRVAHHVETLLDLARHDQLAISPEVVDVVLQSADYLRTEVDAAEGRGADPLAIAGFATGATPLPQGLVDRIEHAMLPQAAALPPAAFPMPVEVPTPTPAAAPRPAARAAVEPIDARRPAPGHGPVRIVEVMPPTTPEFLRAVVPGGRRIADQPLATPDPKTAAPAGPARKGSAEPREAVGAIPLPPRDPAAKDPARPAPDAATVRVETAKLDHLLEMIGEMVIAQSMVQHHPALSAIQEPQLASSLLALSRITRDVQNATMGVRTIPIAQLFHRSARVVRDLSRRMGKEVALEMTGEHTEIDRKIAEELSDPLLHMIRNALDHGIETAAQRVAAGKSPLAKLRLAAYHQGGQVVVEIGDDGRGLDRERILAKALEGRLVESGAQLTDDDVYQLIFKPGFSTAETITDLSGRGVGMDVVREQVQKLRGNIEIRSTPGQGARFLLKLPLTLAILDALVVGVGNERYLLPVAAVLQIFRPRPEMLSTLRGKYEMVLLHEKLLPIVRLHQRFHIEPRTTDPCEGLLIQAECEGHVFCLLVDDLHGRQEVVMKRMSDVFKGIAGVSSCAILGDGRVGLILELAGVFRGPGRDALLPGLTQLAPAAHRAQTVPSASIGM